MRLFKKKKRKASDQPKAWSLTPPSSSGEAYPDLQNKAEAINLLLLQPDVDLWKLREFCLTEGGLVNDTLRKRAWPKLVGLNQYGNQASSTSDQSKPQTPASSDANAEYPGSVISSAPKFEIDASVLQSPEAKATLLQENASTRPVQFPLEVPACLDNEQIERDVARCTWHLLTGSQRSRRLQHENKHRKKVASLLRRKQRRLANLINLSLSQSSGDLRYYQGYHDVACIFLHALGNPSSNKDPLGVELPARVLNKVSQFQLRDSCRTSFESLQQCLQWTLFPLLAKLDPVLHNHLYDSDMEPFFCLSWILTWFAHDVRDTNLVKRLFDAFLVSHPLLVLYVCIAMMIHPINRKIILETDCDFAALHHTLSMLPKNSSSVGWKRGRQGGYISDDEEDADEDDSDEEEGEDDYDNKTANTGVTSNWDESVVSSDKFVGKAMSLATSTTIGLTLTPNSSVDVRSNFATREKEGTSSSQSETTVPFQLLIDNALAYMKQYPPSSLMKLAQSYFQQPQISAQSISMLSAPPTWAICSFATADWVYKQRVRQKMGLKKTSRKDRRKKKITGGLPSSTTSIALSELSDKDFLIVHQRAMVVIAAGYGPFGAKEEEVAFRRHRFVLRSAVVVGIASLILGVVYQYYNKIPTEILEVAGNKSLLPPSDADDYGCNIGVDEAMIKNEFPIETKPPNNPSIVERDDMATAAAQNTSSTPVSKRSDPSPFQTVSSSTASVQHNDKIAASQKIESTSASKRSGPSPFQAVSSSKASLQKIGAMLTQANSFPSQRGSTNASRPSIVNEEYRLSPPMAKMDRQVKKITLALYRYLYFWTTKLIRRPIQIIKSCWQMLPRSPPQPRTKNG